MTTDFNSTLSDTGLIDSNQFQSRKALFVSISAFILAGIGFCVGASQTFVGYVVGAAVLFLILILLYIVAGQTHCSHNGKLAFDRNVSRVPSEHSSRE